MINFTKNYFTFIFFIIIQFSISNTIVVSQGEKPILIGNYKWTEWLEQTGREANPELNYKPSSEKVDILKNLIFEKEFSFLIFAGSWCGDSKTELPKLFNLFNLCNLEPDSIPLIGVDRQKIEPTGISQYYRIERVPTLIVLLDNKEIGRIIEFPEITWEDDLIKLLGD